MPNSPSTRKVVGVEIHGDSSIDDCVVRVEHPKSHGERKDAILITRRGLSELSGEYGFKKPESLVGELVLVDYSNKDRPVIYSLSEGE